MIIILHYIFTGSLAGGQILTLSGRGFDSDTVIDICGNICEVQGDPTSTQYTCRTPESSGKGTQDPT